jgi:hypothetical protein
LQLLQVIISCDFADLDTELPRAFYDNHRIALLKWSISYLPGTHGEIDRMALEGPKMKLLHHRKDLDEVVFLLQLSVDDGWHEPSPKNCKVCAPGQ